MFDLLKYGDRTAVITDKGERLTYAELDAMTRIDVPRGLVFCLCSNTLQSFVGYLTCLQSNLPVVMLDGSKPKDVIDALVEAYNPEYIWDGELKPTGLKGESVSEELAMCLTTSGSTGSPKFVRLSAQNILSNAESIAEYLHIDENERPVTTLPMYYSYGLSVINSHLIKGASILLTDGTYAQREFWNFMREQKATSMAGVPYTYEILKRLRFFRMELPDLKVMTQAGGKLNKDIAKEYIEFAAEKGKKFYVMYGQTEATARMSYLPWESALEKYASIGVAIPGGKFSIIDTEGKEITEPEKDGELIYEGKNVSLGYAECRADLAKSDENKGVLKTGDVARRDADGFYYITGRLKRFVKIWGNRCNLDATEQIVKSITTNCACAGVDDKITVFVTEDGLSEQIISLLSEKTGLNSRAFEVRVIDAIPKNDSGKVQYAALQQLLK
ncbi:MAG: AMP-binding protein [Bacteroidales bacterium]|nr:AMP-binding protein [Bacteroidales bacterium]